MTRKIRGLRSYLVCGHKIRKVIQYGFFITVVFIGIQFYYWYRCYAAGGNSWQVSRPPGVEGFLPLSALISLKYWLLSGIFNHIHPSSLVILLAVLAMSLTFKKSFCSFVCPVGLISEWLWKLGRKVLGKKASAPWGWRVPRWIDYPMRSLKYILLAFFIYAILIKMDVKALRDFIDSPYNKVADVKMLMFFVDISRFALGVIILLAVASFFITNFWCRYLCPYGALLGFLSFLSPVKIRRNIPTCTDCEACTKVCPAMVKVHKEKTVRSDECTGCLECVAVCPAEDTLYPAMEFSRRKISTRGFALGALAIFMAFYIGARLTGHWQNSISSGEYMYHIERMDGPEYNHPR